VSIENEKSAPGWWAPCIDCGVSIIVDKGDSSGVPDPSEWDPFPQCPVCGATVSFDEATESQWDREARLMAGARGRAVDRIRAELTGDDVVEAAARTRAKANMRDWDYMPIEARVEYRRYARAALAAAAAALGGE